VWSAEEEEEGVAVEREAAAGGGERAATKGEEGVAEEAMVVDSRDLQDTPPIVRERSV